jgi:hypothetical protein
VHFGSVAGVGGFMAGRRWFGWILAAVDGFFGGEIVCQ